MIDWITAVVPCTHVEPIRDGVFQRVDASGDVEWSTDRRLSVSGSFESAVTIRTASWEGDRTHIEISGNLCKFFQGHNLWGTDDAPALTVEFLRWLAVEHGLKDQPLVSPTEADIAAWMRGDFYFTRADITDSYQLANRADVLAWLHAADGHARIRNGGRGMLKGDTLYFDPGSRRRTLKLYAKGQEIEANAEHQPALRDLPRARAWADNILRAELCLRSMELQRLGLRWAANWLPMDGVPFDPLQLLRDRLGTMTMTTARTLPEDVSNSLTTAQRLAYSAWLNGEDLRGLLPNGSFYRLRAKLLPCGIDISICRNKNTQSNVVPLVRVLEAKPANIPDWAEGTPLYFEPRRIA
jgi:II/X family phage/plasmid replication protein